MTIHEPDLSDMETDAWSSALDLAWAAFRAGTTPVGAVVIDADARVVATGRNRRMERTAPEGQLADAHIAHAEVNALATLAAGRQWGDHRLLSTLEPCGMCHGAAIASTIGGLAYAAPDPYAGTAGVVWANPVAERRGLVVAGPLDDERGALCFLMHVAWLLEAGADRPLAAQHEGLPELTAYAVEAAPALRRAADNGDLATASNTAARAPWPPAP